MERSHESALRFLALSSIAITHTSVFFPFRTPEVLPFPLTSAPPSLGWLSAVPALGSPTRFRFGFPSCIPEAFVAVCAEILASTTVQPVLELRWDKSSDSIANAPLQLDSTAQRPVAFVLEAFWLSRSKSIFHQHEIRSKRYSSRRNIVSAPCRGSAGGMS